MNTQLHPIFQDLANSFHHKCAEKAKAASLEAYKIMLGCHDWGYAYSDSHEVYCRGRDFYGRIRQLQAEIDADYAIWNSIAPEGYRFVRTVCTCKHCGATIVKDAECPGCGADHTEFYWREVQ